MQLSRIAVFAVALATPWIASAQTPSVPAESAAPVQDPPAAPTPAPPADVAVQAPPAAPSGLSPEGNGAFGSNTWGSRGAYRVFAARPLVDGGIVLTISDEYFSASDVFVAGDTDQQSTQRMRIIWSPILGLELGLAQVSTVNKYFDLLPRTFQVQGNPSLLVKYSRSLMPELGVGAVANLLIPTSEFGAGLTPGALTLTAMGLVSYQPTRWIELSANIGYIFDQSEQLFPNVAADRQQAFVYEINNANRMAYGLAAVTDLPVGDAVTLAPYLEFSGALGSGSLSDNPLRGTLGLKLYTTQSRSIEVSLGGDLRLGGQPEVGSAYAGIPPWTVFGQFSVHLGESLDKPGTTVVTQAVASCSDDAGCAAGQSCQGNVCVAVREVVREKEVIKEVVKEAPTFTLTGGVVDSATGEPVSYAQVAVSGYDSVLAVDAKSGQFSVWPLTVGTGLVQLKVKAAGYLDAEQTIPRGAAGEAKQVVFKLKGDNRPQFGTLKGTLKDARTGEPLANAKIFIPVLGQRVTSGADGSFEAQCKVGRYAVLFNAKKYITQKKELNIRNGDVVIMNVDLRPKKRPGR